jgi:shikimate kinase
MNEEARKACLLNCVVIYLDMSWEEWKERLELLMDNRPVLQSRSLDEIQKLFNERRKIYAHHHFKITVDQKSAEEAADEIVQSVKSLW